MTIIETDGSPCRAKNVTSVVCGAGERLGVVIPTLPDRQIGSKHFPIDHIENQ